MFVVELSENCSVEPVLAGEKLFVCPECGERVMKNRNSRSCRSCARRRSWERRNHSHKVTGDEKES